MCMFCACVHMGSFLFATAAYPSVAIAHVFSHHCAAGEPCGEDKTPGDGDGCKGGPSSIQVRYDFPLLHASVFLVARFHWLKSLSSVFFTFPLHALSLLFTLWCALTKLFHSLSLLQVA